MAGPLVGADGDPRVPTINIKNVNGGLLALMGGRGGGGVSPHLVFERCVVICIGMINKK
jgi:hypothetical protein